MLKADTPVEGTTGHIGVGSWDLFVYNHNESQNAGAVFKECVSGCRSQVQFGRAESVALKQQLVQCAGACERP